MGGVLDTPDPVHVTPGKWSFPPLEALPDGEDFIATGADLEPSTLLAAYTSGFFPMPVDWRNMGWFSPDPRGVIIPSQFKESRSLRQSRRRYRCTVNAAFDEVLTACGDPSRPNGWIDRRIRRGYQRLHTMGWVHSVEAWDDEGLAGGLYGVGVAGLFAGESMFFRRRDASKVALAHLIELLGDLEATIVDVQWLTPHLATMGATEVPRPSYRHLLDEALQQGAPFASWPAQPGSDQ